MIAKVDILDQTFVASPTFKAIADKELASKGEGDWYDYKGEILAYIMLGDFAGHIIESYQCNIKGEFGNIFELIEKL